ncbi:hypothetical protein HED50_09295 [Ochrobactrum oryzae]|nr:hypothetical protein [Brucella oryzae]
MRDSFVKKKQEKARSALMWLEKPTALPFHFIDIWSKNLRSLALSDEKCAGLVTQLDAALLNIAQISENLENEKAEKNLIVNSRTWRMTAPVRWLFSKFR